MLELRQWNKAETLPLTQGADLGDDSITYLARAIGAARSGHAEEARRNVAEIESLWQEVAKKIQSADSEIALARSAAPESISRDAEVLVLGRHGYETASQGKNGFVCMVQRSWVAPTDDPEFWNPKMRAPMCLNAT